MTVFDSTYKEMKVKHTQGNVAKSSTWLRKKYAVHKKKISNVAKKEKIYSI